MPLEVLAVWAAQRFSWTIDELSRQPGWMVWELWRLAEREADERRKG